MSGDRQLVRAAVASYFGGSQITTDGGIAFQGGPLTASGLGTVYPYTPKGIPDGYYTAGQADGVSWGAVMTIASLSQQIDRTAIAGKVTGWRKRYYEINCALFVISYEPHLETAEAGLDDLIDAAISLIYADRTLGTTNAVLYPTGRLITQAGEAPFGIRAKDEPGEIIDDRGQATIDAVLSFQALTMVMS